MEDGLPCLVVVCLPASAVVCSPGRVGARYELLHRFDVLPDTPTVNTLHLCEGPGAFVAATNHFLRTRFGDALNWTSVHVVAHSP